MRRQLVVLFTLSILIFTTILTDSSSAEDNCYLRLSAVYPTSSSEGFALTNYGLSDADLMNFYVTDGEGTVKFTESILLRSGETLYILKGEPPVWMNDVNYLLYGTAGIKARSFSLNDSGDDLYLYCNGELVDSFVYGNINGTINGWNGEAFEKIPKNRIAERYSFTDTDSKADWKISNHMKIFDLDIEGYEANVIPFTFPESNGEPIIAELSRATMSVDISVYLINHPTVISVLDHLLSSGVHVRILIEGAPAGGISDDELGLLAALYKHGAEIRVIHSGDFGKRFNYLHNKYAIIDGESVVITTENWQKVSFESNRGWGAVIRSAGYAGYLEQVFEYDFGGYDTDDLMSMYPKIKPYSVEYYTVISVDYETIDCTVYPVLSPDNSLSSLKEFIYSAEDRIYIQQLEVESSWLEQTDNPLSWVMERSFEGLDCRLMICSVFDEEDSGSYYVQNELSNYDLECRLYEGTGLLHNKGILTEDKVWLGSVNWTDNSISYNREAAVIMYSSELSEYYSTFFLSDWGNETITEFEIVVKFEEMVISGETTLIDASESISGDDAIFYWDLDSDGEYERKGKKIPVIFSSGINNIKLRVVNGDLTYDESFQIIALEKGNSIEIPWKYLPFILLCISIIIISIIKRSDRDDR